MKKMRRKLKNFRSVAWSAVPSAIQLLTDQNVLNVSLVAPQIRPRTSSRARKITTGDQGI